MTHQFEFKKFKTLLRCTTTDDNGEKISFRLSYPQWDTLSTEWMIETNPDGTKRLYQYQRAAMPEGVTYRGQYQTAGGPRTSPNMLTAMGVALCAQLPKCPPEHEWPRNRSSRTRVRLSDTQKKVLQTWTTNRSEAVPLGSIDVAVSRWVGGDGWSRTANALLRQGMIEVGIRGVTFDDDGHQVGNSAELVYRPTIHGALIAGGEEE